MKLHLGCGQKYLDGYVNIDFPLSSHSVQKKSIADLHSDILDLRYERASVEEIRLHHVFEHFPRPVACGLLAAWFTWLKPNGRIHIEVPDFLRTACYILNPIAPFKNKAVAERHLFGSHEASWAVHCEGYTPDMLKKMLTLFGFDVSTIKNNTWRDTHNFELFATRKAKSLVKAEFIIRADKYLRNFLLDESEVELRLLATWMGYFSVQLEKGWAQ